MRKVKMDPRYCPRPRPEARPAADRSPGLRLPDVRTLNHRDPVRRPHALWGRKGARPGHSAQHDALSTHSLRRPLLPKGFRRHHNTPDAPAGPAVKAWQVLVVTGGFTPPPLKAEPRHAAAALWTYGP